MKHRLTILLALASLLLLVTPVAAAAAPTWAPVATATIRPGNATLTGDALCTSNFVFHDAAGNVYLGQAAHCSSDDDDAGSLDGCLNNSLPLGTPVRVAGASRPATLVYNSWIAMDQRGEVDVDRCVYNDFALIKLDPVDYGAVNPSLRFAGGPAGIAPGAMDGSTVYGFGTTYDRTGLRPHAKSGVSLRQGAGGLTHVVRMDPPGISGDSGSGLVDAQGRAFGVLSTYSPRRGVNGAGDLSRMLDYMRGSGFADVTLAHGTEPFIAGPPPAVPSQDPVGDLLRDLLGGLLAPLG